MVKRISPLASNEKFQVRFLVELLTIDCRSTAELEYMLQEPDVVGSKPTGATLMQINAP